MASKRWPYDDFNFVSAALKHLWHRSNSISLLLQGAMCHSGPKLNQKTTSLNLQTEPHAALIVPVVFQPLQGNFVKFCPPQCWVGDYNSVPPHIQLRASQILPGITASSSLFLPLLMTSLLWVVHSESPSPSHPFISSLPVHLFLLFCLPFLYFWHKISELSFVSLPPLFCSVFERKERSREGRKNTHKMGKKKKLWENDT